jgi:hypothetical protein
MNCYFRKKPVTPCKGMAVPTPVKLTPGMVTLCTVLLFTNQQINTVPFENNIFHPREEAQNDST